MIVTKVVDFGSGIEKSIMPALFKTFNKKSKGAAKGNIFSTSGIGVGLSTANSLIQTLGGSIHLRSAKGVGTEVMFSAVARPRPTQIMQSDNKHQIAKMVADGDCKFDLQPSLMNPCDVPTEFTQRYERWI